MYWKLTRCRHQGCNVKSSVTQLSGYVRFGSEADICNANRHVRFAPNGDRESGHPQTVMSAIPPKADMCSAAAYVRFGPIADIASKMKMKEAAN
jgi:hypothetical protein